MSSQLVLPFYLRLAGFKGDVSFQGDIIATSGRCHHLENNSSRGQGWKKAKGETGRLGSSKIQIPRSFLFNLPPFKWHKSMPKVESWQQISGLCCCQIKQSPPRMCGCQKDKRKEEKPWWNFQQCVFGLPLQDEPHYQWRPREGFSSLKSIISEVKKHCLMLCCVPHKKVSSIFPTYYFKHWLLKFIFRVYTITFWHIHPL